MPPIFVGPTTQLVKYSDLPSVAALTSSDIICAVQAGVSSQIPFSVMQFLARLQLIPINVSHSVAAGEGGFAVDGSTSSVTLTLPDLASWVGYEIQFINAGPSGTFSVAPLGSDVIVNPSTGAPINPLGSGAVGSSFRLRKVVMPSPGVTGWYITGA